MSLFYFDLFNWTPLFGLKQLLEGAQTEEDRREAWALAEETERKLQDEMCDLKEEMACLKPENGRLKQENKQLKSRVLLLSNDGAKLRQENAGLMRENDRLRVTLSLELSAHVQENDRLKAELARLSAQQA